jgi:hypothetical protein
MVHIFFGSLYRRLAVGCEWKVKERSRELSNTERPRSRGRRWWEALFEARCSHKCDKSALVPRFEHKRWWHFIYNIIGKENRRFPVASSKNSSTTWCSTAESRKTSHYSFSLMDDVFLTAPPFRLITPSLSTHPSLSDLFLTYQKILPLKMVS